MPERRTRVLIVNVFFDEYRRTSGSRFRVPRAMGPAFLAGAFAPSRCEIRLHCEQRDGMLRDLCLLAWPDMLVLTGVTAAFDRMLHLTAYARALNERVVVVAGGPGVRALPRRAAQFFDYACTGDIEELLAIVRATFGEGHAAAEVFPRYDLLRSGWVLGYVESSRNCNFRCSFCSLTGEGGHYTTYDLHYVRRQILATGKRQIVFIDNNFYGNDRDFFVARLHLLRELRQSGRIDGWSALVTGDFFRRAENLALVHEAGCRALFSGVETFDPKTLLAYNKRHNTLVPQVEMIRGCLDAGIIFTYGIMLDPTTRRLMDLRREIEFILGTHEITLPAFFTLAIPLLGTPYFKACLADGLLLPNVRLCHLDGVTVVLRPLDPVAEVVAFARDLPNLRGYRAQVLRHVAGFLRRSRGRLEPLQLYAAAVSGALVCTQTAATSPTRLPRRRPRRTYFGPDEALGIQYRPLMRLPTRYRQHFQPTRVTDQAGALSADLAEDLG